MGVGLSKEKTDEISKEISYDPYLNGNFLQ